MQNYHDAVRIGILNELSMDDLLNAELVDRLAGQFLHWNEETQRYDLPDPQAVREAAEQLREESK